MHKCNNSLPTRAFTIVAVVECFGDKVVDNPKSVQLMSCKGQDMRRIYIDSPLSKIDIL